MDIVYIYPYIRVHIYIYIQTQTNTDTDTDTYIYVHIHMCKRISEHKCMDQNQWQNLHLVILPFDACIKIYANFCMSKHVHIYTFVYICIFRHIYLNTYKYVYTCACIVYENL